MELKNLNQKLWYRLFKVLYICIFALSILFVLIVAYVFIPNKEYSTTKFQVKCGNINRTIFIDNYPGDNSENDDLFKLLCGDKNKFDIAKAFKAGYSIAEVQDFIRKDIKSQTNTYMPDSFVPDIKYTVLYDSSMNGSWLNPFLVLIIGIPFVSIVMIVVRNILLYILTGRNILKLK